MATAIISSLMSFVFVSVLGAYLSQHWQRASWVKQQRYSGREKEYEALKSLSEEIASYSAKRLYAARRCAELLHIEDDASFDQSVSQYGQAVADWMDKLQSFYVRLTLYADYQEFTLGLEANVHNRFYRVGGYIEKLIRIRRKSGVLSRPPASLFADLDAIQAQLFKFNRNMLRLVEERRAEIYFGVKIPYDAYNFRKLTTPELLQLLLKPRVELLGVFRPSFDLVPPRLRGLLGTRVN